MSKYKIRSSMVARVISESKSTYAILLKDGREVHIHKSKIQYFVGDVVEVLEKDDSLTIDKVIKREKIVEKASNRTAKSYRYGNSNKVLASNVDQIYIFVATNQNLTLSNQCKFKNCNHQNTPGCAVEFALKKGEISQEKLERYLYNQHKLV